MSEIKLRYFEESTLVAEIKSQCFSRPFCGRDPECPVKKFITRAENAIFSKQRDDTDYFKIATEAELVEDGIIVGLDGTTGITYKCHQSGSGGEWAGRVDILRKPNPDKSTPLVPSAHGMRSLA